MPIFGKLFILIFFSGFKLNYPIDLKNDFPCVFIFYISVPQ